MIEFRSVKKVFSGRTVLDGVDFQIHPGEFVCITGVSGAGKSTIVNMFIRAENPTSGSIEVDGKNLKKLPRSILQLYRRRTGVVFQDYKLLGDRTVYENVSFAMEVCGDSNEYIAKRVPALLKRVGLAGREHTHIYELSGGEKARVALARALVHHPMIVIADEPTGNIDPKQSIDILNLLKEVNSHGVTVILATHDDTLLNGLQTRVLHLENGKIVRDTVGGYGKGKANNMQEEELRHNLFEKEEHPSNKRENNDKGGRTIKPIAI